MSEEKTKQPIFPDLNSLKSKGCPCLCHKGMVTYHIVPCHNPLILEVFDRRLPKT